MATMDRIFDHPNAKQRPPVWWLLREIWSLATYHPTPPDPANLPNGKGHVVLVVPAFLTPDLATQPIRSFMTRCGYRAYGWELGINWGPTPRILDGLRRRIRQLWEIEGGPISVVGISLGGMLARNAAHECASDIRHVITLASPIRLPTASTVEPLIHCCAPFYSRDIVPARIAAPLPVSSTTIFTPDDGVVSWESCRVEEAGGVAIGVRGPHTTICRNPDVLRIIAQRLAT